MTDGPLCFSYMRFSRIEQKKGSSTDRQTKLRDDYCVKNNLTLDSRVFLDEGVSGYFGKNKVEGCLKEFLSLIKEGEIPPGSILLVESLDRLGRDEIDSAASLLRSILQAGVSVHTLSPTERVFTKESLNDPLSVIMLVFEFYRAHEFSKQLGSRISAAWASKRAKAKANQTPLCSTCPEWLRVVENKYELIPDRAATVKLIYELAQDMGVLLLARELTRRGVPTFGGKKWTHQYIMRILMSEQAIGHHLPRRVDPQTGKRVLSETIKNLFPAVISEELNQAAKFAMKSRNQKGGRVGTNGPTNPFSGLLKNPNGRSIHVRYRRQGRKIVRSVAVVQDLDTGRSYPLDQFIRVVCKWISSGLLYGTYDNKVKWQQHDQLVKRCDQIDSMIESIKARIQSGESWESLLDVLARAEQDRKEILEKIYESTQRLPAKTAVLRVHAILREIDKAGDQDRIELWIKLRGALQRMIDRIEVEIGDECRFWQGKTLTFKMVFKDSSERRYFYDPEQTILGEKLADDPL